MPYQNYNPDPNQTGEDDLASWLRKVGGGARDWLAGPTENRDAVDTEGNPVVGPRVRATETVLGPMELGQKKALGVDMTQPTYPPRTPAAPTKATGVGRGFEDVISGNSSSLDPKELGQKKALGGESYGRYKLAGGEWQDIAPRGDDTRGHSETDWSAIANPMQFEAFRERPEISDMERYIKDPLWQQREQAGIKMAENLGQYQGERQLDLATEAQRTQGYREIESRKQADLAHLRSTPQYRAATPDKQAYAEKLVTDPYDAEIAARERGSAKMTAKATDFGGGGIRG